MVLQIEQVCVKYADDSAVLDHLNINIKEGETVGIVGENGAGKSTLFKTMVGILFPFEGRILINGLEVNKKNVREARKQLGMVFQNPDDQLFMANVYDDIAFGPRNYGFSETAIQEKIDDVAKALGIERLLHHSTNKLSGGEKRVIAIASILVMEPSILLFDEPTSFLDPKTRRKLLELLKRIDKTKVIATHDLDMALEICERVIILKDGKVFADGEAKTLLKNESLLLEAGLELPFCLQNGLI